MVGVLTSPNRVKPKTKKLVSFSFFVKHAALRKKTGWLGIRIMCLSGAACLSADCCFSELEL
jgi:hypothetical protein